MVSGEDRRPEIARAMFIENLKTIGHYKSHCKFSMEKQVG